MNASDATEVMPCPACGGGGGGPLGRAGSAWDDENYVCPRCKGLGVVPLQDVMVAAPPRPGLVKATPGEVQAPARRKAGS